MTAPLPFWRVTDRAAGKVTVEVDLPDFTRAVVVMAESALNTPAGDAMIRAVVDGRESTKDSLREGP